MISGKVSQSFSVLVVDPHDRPLEGVKVEIREIAAADLDPLKTGVTDKDGRAYFRGAEPGRFALCYWHLLGGDCPAIQIGESPEARDQIEVRWPARPIQKVRKIAGTFLLAGTNYTLTEAKISVTDAWTGNVVGTTVTDGSGQFRIDVLKSRLYVLNLEQHFEGTRPKLLLTGNIFIEVSPDAAQEKLPAFPVTMSSCGLTAKMDEKNYVIF
jgi:hypothetical protein